MVFTYFYIKEKDRETEACYNSGVGTNKRTGSFVGETSKLSRFRLSPFVLGLEEGLEEGTITRDYERIRFKTIRFESSTPLVVSDRLVGIEPKTPRGVLEKKQKDFFSRFVRAICKAILSRADRLLIGSTFTAVALAPQSLWKNNFHSFQFKKFNKILKLI